MRRLILGVAVLAPLAVLALPLSGGGGAGATGRCGAHPWCDTALSPDRRAALVLRAMTLDEKLALLAGTKTANFNARLAGVPRLGIPRALVADGPAGISRGEDGTALTQPGKSEALAMPAPVALAASFDPATARLYGETVGAEARSRGLDVLLGPAMDLVRTPRAGRGFETFGEDPLLSGRIAAAWIRGAQSRGVIATAKHFVAYNQETRRFRTDARVGERALRELYLPPFEAAVRAGVGAVMSSYNRVNGTYMDENGPLLRRVLQGEWRFPGMVVSDFSVGTHGTDTSLKGGLDVELPEAQFYKPELLKPALAAGVVPRRLIDDADGRILRTLFAAGFPDRAGYRNRGPRATTPARRAAARTVAERGMVLLRNRRGALPLDGKVRSLAVIGDAARAFEVGGGSSQVDPVTSVTPLVGIRARARGRARVSFTRGTSPAAAARAARRADAAVVVVSDDSSEFEDKTGIALADGDPACTGRGFGACGPPPARNADALVRAVAAANPRTVVVLETGGPVLLPWAGRVSAILEAWYPGQEGGSALARVLWGDVDPSGRLPQTFPRRPGDLAVHTRAQFPGVRGRARYSEGIFVGYRHFDRAGIRPLYAFGHGGSYTSFTYRGLRLAPASGRRVRVSLRVANIGRRAGVEVPQLYVRVPSRVGLPQPPRRLAGMARVALGTGRARRISFTLDARALRSWDPRRHRWTVVAGCYGVEVGASSRDIRRRGRFARGGARCP